MIQTGGASVRQKLLKALIEIYTYVSIMKLNTAERWDEMSDIGLKEKKEIIEQNKIHETDTGSADVQIAILSERINHLIEHLKLHKKDNHSRKGLLILVGRRKRLMNYLKKYNLKRFLTLAKKLKLRI